MNSKIVGRFIISYHVLLAVCLPLYLIYFTPPLALLIITLVLIVLSGLGITAGYHRLFAHKAYEARPIVQRVLLFFGTLNIQGSCLQWVSDHRNHHRYVDTDADPYAITKGFWYAHCLWLFHHCNNDYSNVADLQKNRLVMFQHNYYGWLVLAVNVGFVLAIGAIVGDVFGAFVFVFLLRLFINHHTTWFINSIAHFWGVQPYSKEHTAVNNWLVSLVTYGEGYHNYHHSFASDYRNGVRWYQFDPTKILIWTMSKFGLVSNLKRSNKLTAKVQLLAEDRRLMLDHLRQKQKDRWEAIETEIAELYAKLCETIEKLREQYNEYMALRRAKSSETSRRLKLEMKALKRRVREQSRSWDLLCERVLAI